MAEIPFVVCCIAGSDRVLMHCGVRERRTDKRLEEKDDGFYLNGGEATVRRWFRGFWRERDNIKLGEGEDDSFNSQLRIDRGYERFIN